MRCCQTLFGLLLLSVLALAIPAPALACAYCFNLAGNPLALPHPKAIEIAVATRAAIDKGVLKDNGMVPGKLIFGSDGGMVALHKVPAPLLVKAWAAKLKAETYDESLSVHFLFIDTEQSCGLGLRGGVVLFEAAPAANCDARVVTTRGTFYALLSGTLNLTEARKLNLFHVEGDARAAHVLPGGK